MCAISLFILPCELRRRRVLSFSFSCALRAPIEVYLHLLILSAEINPLHIDLMGGRKRNKVKDYTRFYEKRDYKLIEKYERRFFRVRFIFFFNFRIAVTLLSINGTFIDKLY